MMLANVKRLLPPVAREPLRRALRKTQAQYWRARFGRHSDLVPPLELMHDGPQSYKAFKANGEEFLGYYIKLCGLRPDEHMLDVGSGIGRKTLPLVSYLSSRGTYDGLDLVKGAVEWCRKRYTSKYPNFRFHLIDVHSHLYNREGTFNAAEYRFPFDDQQFDFVVLNSVFTHMLPEEVENYMREIARVLKSGGRCLISYFLLNEESLKLVEQGKSIVDLRHQLGTARVLSREAAELAIGFEEDFVVDLYERVGLRISRAIAYGSWCGRKKHLSCQDLIVAVRNTHTASGAV